MADESNDLEVWLAATFPSREFVHQGGQRRVYRVREPADSALKIWPSGEDVQHERHVREVSALGRLNHPGLPRVVAHLSQVEIGERVFAMYQEQWLNAPSVGQQLSEMPLEPADFRAFLETTLDTLTALHAEQIVHRDISFGNVLWDGRRAYIVDLGIAKHLELDTVTSTGQEVGMTVNTASPEQLQGVRSDLQPATDVYSLGVVAYVAATGGHPFIKEDERIILPQLLRRQLTKDFARKLPPHASILDKMLVPVSVFRPPSHELLEEFRSG